MNPENIFELVKNYHKTALQSFQALQSQNERMMTLFLEGMQKENLKLDNNYREWLTNTKKAFEDYQSLILKGLDYLSVCFEKNGDKAPRKPSDGTQKK